MAAATPIVNYMSSNFVITAGCLLFRLSPTTNNLQLCILYHRKWGKWLLPKGRKDCRESIDIAAIRETYEETGYPCELLPCRMPTRAPQPGVNTIDAVAIQENITEPFAVTMQDLGGDKGVKFIWWYIARVKGNATEKVAGTQTDSETYNSHFLDVEAAILQITFQNDRDLAIQAWNLVKDTASIHPQQMSGLFSA